jgi:probable phosphoglycerate mutase
MLEAYIDGGARNNPGPAGAGVYLELDGAPLVGLYEYLGKQTNNYAEYSALLGALKYALAEGVLKLKVYSDSELLVRQVLGRYRVKNPALQTLHQQALAMIRQLEQFSIQHVPRALNRKADALANKAMDLQANGEEKY